MSAIARAAGRARERQRAALRYAAARQQLANLERQLVEVRRERDRVRRTVRRLGRAAEVEGSGLVNEYQTLRPNGWTDHQQPDATAQDCADRTTTSHDVEGRAVDMTRTRLRIRWDRIAGASVVGIGFGLLIGWAVFGS